MRGNSNEIQRILPLSLSLKSIFFFQCQKQYASKKPPVADKGSLDLQISTMTGKQTGEDVLSEACTEMGKIDTEANNSKPYFYPQVIDIPETDLTHLEILLQVSNFHHRRRGIICTVLALNSLMFGERYFYRKFFGFPYNWGVTLEFLTFNTAIPAFILFIAEVFLKEIIIIILFIPLTLMIDFLFLQMESLKNLITTKKNLEKKGYILF